MKILVLSCDKSVDLFYPFHHCIEKYWPEHPEIIYSTESVGNPYYKTICINYDLKHWSLRVKECLELLNDEYVLIMVDDIFLRHKVDNDYFNYIVNSIPSNATNINLELSFDKKDIPYNDDLKKRWEKGKYKTSVMCGVWNRERAIQCFDIVADPWEIEQINDRFNFTYYVLNNKQVLDWGHTPDKIIWGVYQGKWTQEALDFLQSEGFNVINDRVINTSARGVFK